MRERVLAWASPRRWSILVEAVLAVLLALLAWPIAAIGGDDDEQVQVVTDYLEALRDGDVEAANEYIGEGLFPEADKSWLTEEALSGDWEIESVAHRSASDLYVHAVISSGGQTAETVFVVEDADEGPRITNPYMYLAVPSGPLQALELNGQWNVPQVLEEYSMAQVALFPGSYDLFEDVQGFSGENAVSFLAMPQDLPIALTSLAGGAIASNGGLEEQLNADLAAWIDFCAQSEEAAPEGCPFSAESSSYGPGIVDDGITEFEEVQDLTWTVDVYPHLRIGPDMVLTTVAPGWVTLSGSGVPKWEGTGTSLQGRCRISLSSVDVNLLAGGQFEFTSTEDLSSTCGRGLT
ncbi:hypothetical protein [Glycomyces arizonensis]|uniref:hypothetical protein n=1 Tax=Glycomyces arizonensis TaxID=256035 RepID=UPI000417180E|nr:hypothetical protein [Glycomyces arizonensis]